MASSDPDALSSLRWLRIAGIGDLVVGAALLIAGFATGTSILWIVGAVLVASAGTLFVLVRMLAAQHAVRQPLAARQPSAPAPDGSRHDAFGRERPRE